VKNKVHKRMTAKLSAYYKFKGAIHVIIDSSKWIAAISIALMMLLTTADIILRFFHHPITGSYEIVGFLGALFASFSLSYTAVMGLHISVDFAVKKLSLKVRNKIELFNHIVSAILFGLISWQSIKYGISLKVANEVSLTLKIPTYPFAFGIAVGCAILSLFLILKSMEIIFEKFDKQA